MACMKRRDFLAAALVLAAVPGRALGRATGGAAVALVTADLEAHVVALELSSGRVVKRIRTAPGPRSIEASPYGQVVVAHIPAGVVTILDAATLSVRAVLHGFGEPRYAAMHPGEPLAYVTDSALEQVVAIDLDRGRVVHRTRVPGPARHVSVDAGTTLWTVLGSAAERVAVLDLADPRRPRLVRVFEPPFRAHDVVFAPDGTHVWVTSGASNALALYRQARRRSDACLRRERRRSTSRSPTRGRSSRAVGTEPLQRRRPDGSPLRTTRVPHGSYNVTFGAPSETFGHPAVVTPSLNEGTVAVLEPNGAVRFVRHVTRSAHDACVAQAG